MILSNIISKKKIILLTILAVVLSLFHYLDGQQYISTDFLITQHKQDPIKSAFIFVFIYIAVTGLSLPGAAILTIAGGYIFGFLSALIMISFASSIGATIAFTLSRFLFKKWVQLRFEQYTKKINKKFSEEGPLYLLSLRLIPAFPFFIINIVMGLLPIKTRTFYWISQLGMLPGTAIYVNAGAQAGGISELSLKGIMTPEIIFSFILLAIFPIITKKTLSFFQVIKNQKSL